MKPSILLGTFAAVVLSSAAPLERRQLDPLIGQINDALNQAKGSVESSSDILSDAVGTITGIDQSGKATSETALALVKNANSLLTAANNIENGVWSIISSLSTLDVNQAVDSLAVAARDATALIEIFDGNIDQLSEALKEATDFFDQSELSSIQAAINSAVGSVWHLAGPFETFGSAIDQEDFPAYFDALVDLRSAIDGAVDSAEVVEIPQ